MVSFVKLGSVGAVSRLKALSFLGKETVIELPRPSVEDRGPIDGDKSGRRKWRRRLVIVACVRY